MSGTSPDRSADRFCFRCGYNLRGLAGDPTRCPECGTPNRYTTRYTCQQHSWLWGQYYRVQDERGLTVFEMRQPVLSLTRAFRLSEPSGREVLRIRQRVRLLNSVYDVSREGARVAVLNKQAVTKARRFFEVRLTGEVEDRLDGELTRGECLIRRNGIVVAASRVKWLSLRNMHEVEIARGEDVPLLLSIILMVHIAPI